VEGGETEKHKDLDLVPVIKSHIPVKKDKQTIQFVAP
jgi:hypothetical protein